jgi:hypothetical protein
MFLSGRFRNENMKKQIILLHGGDIYDTYEEYIASLKGVEMDFERVKAKDWKFDFGEKLGADFEVVAPKMPSPTNAKYLEWKIWFDKLVPFFEDGVILIGHSLGGIFLAKYLSENNLSKKITATFLIAAPYSKEDVGRSLVDFVLPNDLGNLQKQGGKMFIYHSKDDKVVVFSSTERYIKAIPTAQLVVFEDRGHFNQREFPELVDNIKSLFL